jgi:3-hydroxyisobutyrate dehydrogenase-like beta-hydroxyacid dehydrogenase
MSVPSSPNSSGPVGLIGIGLLGTAMAERLIKDGIGMVGFDLNTDRIAALRDLGGDGAREVGEVFARCGRVLLSLPSHDEVRAVIAAHSGNLRRGQIVIDTTTGDPHSTEVLAAQFAEHGVGFLDATVSGSSAQMRNGAAVLMVGGDKKTFDACADIFALLSCDAFHTGPAGSGAKMKLATNLVLGLNRAALAEGLAFAGSLSLDPELTLAVLRRCPAYSRVMDGKGEKMIRGEFSPEARLSQHLKDVRLIVGAGTEAGLSMPLSRAHREILEAAEAAGLGGLDNSAIIRVLEARQPDIKRA